VILSINLVSSHSYCHTSGKIIIGRILQHSIQIIRTLLNTRFSFIRRFDQTTLISSSDLIRPYFSSKIRQNLNAIFYKVNVVFTI